MAAYHQAAWGSIKENGEDTMKDCVAYYEYTAAGITNKGCEALKPDAFRKVQRMRGGCCIANCPFYKQNKNQVRSVYGLYEMDERQKIQQQRFFELNYRGRANVLEP